MARTAPARGEHAHPDRHRLTQNADHLARNGPFSAFFAELVCFLGQHQHQLQLRHHQTGELHYMRGQHADNTPPDGFV